MIVWSPTLKHLSVSNTIVPQCHAALDGHATGRDNTSPYPLVTARHTDSMGTNKATRERLNANRILP